MRWEQVPEISLFTDKTAAFIHDLPADAISNAAGDSNYVRVQVLTPINVLDRGKQLGVVKELTEIVVASAGDPTLADRTWVLITESPEGGWGIDGHANTGADIARGSAGRARGVRASDPFSTEKVVRVRAATKRPRSLSSPNADRRRSPCARAARPYRYQAKPRATPMRASP
jgi:phenylpyruvate tautomerase PptA (4-oxalocrotonate tautomerase family)